MVHWGWLLYCPLSIRAMIFQACESGWLSKSTAAGGGSRFPSVLHDASSSHPARKSLRVARYLPSHCSAPIWPTPVDAPSQICLTRIHNE